MAKPLIRNSREKILLIEIHLQKMLHEATLRNNREKGRANRAQTHYTKDEVFHKVVLQ